MSKTLDEELQNLKDPNHTYKLLQDAVGKKILCEDRTVRLVEKICHSTGNFKYALVNENDETGGFLVHILKLFGQLRNEVPSEEYIQLFDSIVDSFHYEYKKPEAPKKKSGKKKTFQGKFLVN